MSESYGGFRVSTLTRQPAVERGDLVECPRCGDAHRLEGGGSGRRLFVSCRQGSGLEVAAVAGRLVLGVAPDGDPHDEGEPG